MSELDEAAKATAPEESRKRPAPKKESYGEKVKQRRMAAAAALEGNLSKSKRRKVIKEQEKLKRKPTLAFEKEVGKRYATLLSSMKNQEGLETACSRLLELLIPDEGSTDANDSPVRARLIALHKEPTSAPAQQAAVAYLTKQVISRALQACLKVGKPQERARILAVLEPILDKIASCNAAGSHLCMKLITYTGKEGNAKIMDALSQSPKCYFNQCGSRVWDHALRKSKGQSRNRLLMRLFFDKIAVATSLDQSKIYETDPQEIVGVLSESLQRVFKLRMQEFLDKLVLKELLSSELAQHFIAFLVRNDELFSLEDLTNFAESTLEGAQALLNSEDGVHALCLLMGYWNAKQRKQFLTAVAATQKLQNQTWTDYLCNEVAVVAVGRLLTTVDDTKNLAVSILCPAFGVKLSKLGLLKGDDKTAAMQILKSSKAPAVLLHAIKPEVVGKKLTKFERDQLSAPSPTSKKDPEIRRREIAVWLKQIVSTLGLSTRVEDYAPPSKRLAGCLESLFAAIEEVAGEEKPAEGEAMAEEEEETTINEAEVDSEDDDDAEESAAEESAAEESAEAEESTAEESEAEESSSEGED